VPTYDLYPAVDENYRFAPEVRAALATSPELRNTVVPMTTTERNNLLGERLWNGRLIYNTTTRRIDKYDLVRGGWVALADQGDTIVPMSNAARDNLSGGELWHNRMILNLDQERINRYDEDTKSWKIVVERDDLTLLLATSGTPASVGGIQGSRGTSASAARADHVHASPLSGGYIRGNAYIPPESLGKLQVSTILRAVSVAGWAQAKRVKFYQQYYVNFDWYTPNTAESEILMTENAGSFGSTYRQLFPRPDNRVSLPVNSNNTSLEQFYYDSSSQTLYFYLKGSQVEGTTTVGGFTIRWIAEI